MSYMNTLITSVQKCCARADIPAAIALPFDRWPLNGFVQQKLESGVVQREGEMVMASVRRMYKEHAGAVLY